MFLTSLFLSTAWAEAQDSGAAAAHSPSFMDQLPFIFAIFAIIYFLIIRPNSKRQETHKKFVEGMKRGDQVLTSGGILGTIEGLTEQFVTLQIADGVRIRILKTQIASGVADETETASGRSKKS